MPIRRHGKHWQVRVQHAGQRIVQTVHSRADALALERRLQQRVQDRLIGRTPSYSLDEAVGKWLEGEARTLRSYDNLVDKVRMLLPFMQGKALAEVGEVAQAVKKSGIDSGLKPATINRRLAILRRVARLAFREWQWLDADIAGRVTLLGGEGSRHTYLTQDQVRKLMAAATPKVREAIRWLALTGLRKSEFLSVRRDSFKDGCIVLQRHKSMDGGRPRVVPLAAELDPARFPYLTERPLVKGFQEARRRARLDSVRLHDLRHTFASWLAQNGSTPVQMRDLLGHSSLAVTSRYSHLGRKDLWAAVQGLSVGQGRAKGKRVKIA